MEYKEPLFSKMIYSTRELLRKVRMMRKKIIKLWKQRREYFSLRYIEEKFKKREQHCSGKREQQDLKYSMQAGECHKEKIGKLAVYTCIFGSYDKILEPLISSKFCDYYIMTDLYIMPESKWKKIEPKKYPDGFDTWHPAVKNRYYKMHPHELFPGYEYSLYIDGNIKPMTDLYPLVMKVNNAGKIMGLFLHPIFECIYDSAEHLKRINLVDGEAMDSQIERYSNEKFPHNYGFFECSLIVRQHNQSGCIAVMETWWKEYMNGVKRDQQSFTYALWKNGLCVSDLYLLGQNIRDDSRVKLKGHCREHRRVP